MYPVSITKDDMSDYTRLYDDEKSDNKRQHINTLEFIIKSINNADKSTISSKDFKNEIIAYCNRYNSKKYNAVTSSAFLNRLYNSYEYKTNVVAIINLYLNNFITFDDVMQGFVQNETKVSAQDNNYRLLLSNNKDTLAEIQTIITSSSYPDNALSHYGFIINGKKDILYINTLINAYNSGIVVLTDNMDNEMDEYKKYYNIVNV